jgi:hypothetical protein
MYRIRYLPKYAMRDLINLITESQQTVTLYRGDASEIERFTMDKADSEALFGRGIYLTDSPEVAADYTLKGNGGDIVFQSGAYNSSFQSKEQLIQAYLEKICMELGYEEEAKRLKEQWHQIALERQNKAVIPDGLYWDGMSSEEQNKAHVVYREIRNKPALEARAEYEVERRALSQKFVAKAKKVYRERIKDMRIIRQSTGAWVFVKSERGGTISTFEVPRAYCEMTLDTEAPLADDVLPILRDAFYAAYDKIPYGTGRMDLRVWDAKGDEKFPLSFDDYVEGYKTMGSRYAWADHNIGGKGKNPTVDELLNGTHAGYHVLKNAQDKLIADLKGKGYVGFRYQGGVRVGGTGNRGGGGVLHNAYSFWDEKVINGFRGDHHAYEDPKVDPSSAKGMRSTSVL